MDIIIRQIEAKDYEDFARISQSAYPGAYKLDDKTRAEIIEGIEKFESAHDMSYIGAYVNDKLVGLMRFYTFEMNFHGETITASGIGSVAVDLLYKKRGVAKALIAFANEHSRKLEIPIITLYPFKAEFYQNFGYGYGVPLFNYKIAPSHFKDYKIREGFSFTEELDFGHIEACYNTYVQNNHGMMFKSTMDRHRIERRKDSRIVTFEENGEITGYAIITQQGITKDNMLRQSIYCPEFIYNTPKALQAFSSFFHTQKDQVEYIDLHTFDDRFYHMLCDQSFVPDPLHLSLISHKINDTSLGLMYMALDPAELIEWVEDRVDENLVFNIISPKHGSDEQFVEAFEINPGYMERLEIDFPIQSFSSWIMGAISLEQLYYQGKIQCALPQKLKVLDRKFALDTPKCMNMF